MKDGGSAFPVYAHEGAVDPGMTLRDYFAGQALPAIIESIVHFDGSGDQEIASRYSYMFADAMLAERGKE